jgi:radical SAM superfamily enzyme YgiQ (UPF0313 family)
MKLLLVHPRFPYRGRDAFPLGLGYLAAIARDKAEVTVVDENVVPLDLEEITREPPDIVGITSTTPSFPRALEIAWAVKKRAKNARIVMGGTHVTFRPEEALTKGVDIVVRGEGEHTFRELLEGRELREIRGISYRMQGEIRHNPEREPVAELDSLPFPAWEYFPLRGYGIMSIVTSRGCPYSCSYCCASRFWGHRVRYRSPENVLEELRRISALGYKRVRFMDSTFTLDKKRALKICELIKKELDLRWSCETRADALDEDILRALAESGCNLLCLGVDSGSQRVLDETRRKMRVEAIKKAFDKIREHGIATRAYVTFGFPGESEKGVKETLKLLKELKPDQILLSLATAYPGTELWGKAGIELPASWVAKFHGHGRGGRLYLPSELSKKEYMRLADCLWREVRRLNKAKARALKVEGPQ